MQAAWSRGSIGSNRSESMKMMRIKVIRMITQKLPLPRVECSGNFRVTVLTLPLVRKGGTSIILTCIAFGVIMSVSRYIEEDEPNSESDKTETSQNKMTQAEIVAT